MIGLLLLTISTLLALIGAGLNTTHKGDDQRRTVFKRPNAVGWIVIALILVAFAVQWYVKRVEAKERFDEKRDVQTRRLTDSLNIAHLLRRAHDDSLSFSRQLALAESTFRQQLGVLTNTASLIGRSEQIADSLSANFSTSYKRFDQVISQSTSLLNPILPAVIRFRLRIPLSNQWMRPYLSRTIPVRDSLVRTKRIVDEAGIDHISLDFQKYYRGGYPPDSVLFGFTVDSSSVFFINRNTDEVSSRFLNPGYYLYVFERPPPFEYYNTPALLTLEATNLAMYPGPSSPFGPKSMAVNYREGYVVLDVFYQIENVPTAGAISGVNELRNKYLLVSSQMPNHDYQVLSVTFFTGPNFARVTVIPFESTHDISNQKNAIGNSHPTLTYLRYLDDQVVRY